MAPAAEGLPFDRAYRPKPAYEAIRDQLIAGRPRN
jgi:GH35 family endo-1,4-beta-xylanase